ncbi:MAG: hypothetical protein IRZ15_12015, partial [Bryobacteraceae bacterium]|nr:hypothetical protein [Bryobacteraceae bacterium]
MKKIAICSLLRAGSPYEAAYYLQILSLVRRTFTIQSVNVVYDAEPVETRWARDLLQSHGISVRYEIEGSAGRDFDQIEDKAHQWAATCNQCVELALSSGDELTHLAWIESDLSYAYDTMEVLLGRNKPIIAPLIYLGNIFYDSWAFRDKAGRKLFSFPPVDPIGAEPIELNSVGSYVLFDIAVFRSGIRFRGAFDSGLLVGICEDAAKIGLGTYADPTLAVIH